jgi:regulator of cell morphogenesis and NO signaling
MQYTATHTVRELALERPEATRVFEQLHIDYCCGGSRPLAEACADAGVDVETVMRLLEESVAAYAPHAAGIDVQTASLTALITYIVETHHRFTRQEMERLGALLEKVRSVHGQRHPELLEIEPLFHDLCGDLVPHMLKEEQILFPYIVEMQAAAQHQRALSLPPFGSVRHPVRMMMLEHDTAGDLLRRMRAASVDYTVPADGCLSYQTLYQALAAFEADLHQHIHLENNILFPRAVEMENTLTVPR